MTKMSPVFSAFEFLAQTTPGSSAPPPNPLLSFLPMILIAGAMYFLMIAPQRKKQKEHQKLLASLKSGDEIVTTGGIFGTITNVKEDRFVVRVADNTKIEIGKGFVQTVVKSEIEEKK
jgi:preprotein translocase subunit YajC